VLCSATAWNIAVLSPLLGVTWLFGILSVSRQTVIFQYIFAITNTLQVHKAFTSQLNLTFISLLSQMDHTVVSCNLTALQLYKGLSPPEIPLFNDLSLPLLVYTIICNVKLFKDNKF